MSSASSTDDNRVFDPDSEEWVQTNGPVWTVVEPDGIASSDDHESPEQRETNAEAGIVPNCADVGKRHKYKDRETGETHDYCLRCGATKTAPPAAPKVSTTSSARVSTRQTKTLDMLLGGVWFAAGKGVEIAVKHPAGAAAGKMMMLEAGIAGPKLHAGLKKTPIYPYLNVAQSQLGWASDLAMLALPPLIAAFAAAQPEAASAMKPMLVALMMPSMVAIAKSLKEQAELMSKLEEYDEETRAMASAIIDDLISVDKDEDGEGQ